MIILSARGPLPIPRELPTAPVRASMAAVQAPAAPASGPLTAAADNAVARDGIVDTQWRRVIANSGKTGDALNLLSATFDLGADRIPAEAQCLGGIASGFSIAANGLAIAKEIDEGDAAGVVAAGFKFTGGVMSVVDKYIVPGTPYLGLAAQTCRIAGAAIKLFNDEPSVPATAAPPAVSPIS